MMTKYKPSLKDFETPGGIFKFEKDGFTRKQIIERMYKLTDGATDKYRNALCNNLYDRSKSEK
jgi:hypothetical protein